MYFYGSSMFNSAEINGVQQKSASENPLIHTIMSLYGSRKLNSAEINGVQQKSASYNPLYLRLFLCE